MVAGMALTAGGEHAVNDFAQGTGFRAMLQCVFGHGFRALVTLEPNMVQEHILALVQAALREASTTPAQLDCIAYTKVWLLV